MKRSVLGVGVCLLLVCSGCAVRMTRDSQETTEMVIVEGIGPERDRAIEDALRRAVQRVVGVLVQSKSVTEMYKLVESRIITEALGYVESYEILSETDAGDQYRVQLEAEVNVAKIRTDIGEHTTIISSDPSLPLPDDLILPDDPSLGAFVNRYWEPVMVRVDGKGEWIRIDGKGIYVTHQSPGEHVVRVSFLRPRKAMHWWNPFSKTVKFDVEDTQQDIFEVDNEGQDVVVKGKMIGWKVVFFEEYERAYRGCIRKITYVE